MGVARVADMNARFMIVGDDVSDFGMLLEGGRSWGPDTHATCIAFGDVDGDGRDEVGVTRYADMNARYFVLDDATNTFALLKAGGSAWGPNAYATSIAFGNIDNDSREEIGVTRFADQNSRYEILDDANSGFNALLSGGSDWGREAYGTSIAFGDTDGDGRDEIALARHADMNGRYWVLDDATSGFRTILSGGELWGRDAYGTSVAFGDVDADGDMDLGWTRFADMNDRFALIEMNQQ